MTEKKLLLPDKYEPDNYKRLTVPLQSGKVAWIYGAVWMSQAHHSNSRRQIPPLSLNYIKISQQDHTDKLVAPLFSNWFVFWSWKAFLVGTIMQKQGFLFSFIMAPWYLHRRWSSNPLRYVSSLTLEALISMESTNLPAIVILSSIWLTLQFNISAAMDFALFLCLQPDTLTIFI